jgi:hypothetical protein
MRSAIGLALLLIASPAQTATRESAQSKEGDRTFEAGYFYAGVRSAQTGNQLCSLFRCHPEDAFPSGCVHLPKGSPGSGNGRRGP